MPRVLQNQSGHGGKRNSERALARHGRTEFWARFSSKPYIIRVPFFLLSCLLLGYLSFGQLGDPDRVTRTAQFFPLETDRCSMLGTEDATCV